MQPNYGLPGSPVRRTEEQMWFLFSLFIYEIQILSPPAQNSPRSRERAFSLLAQWLRGCIRVKCRAKPVITSTNYVKCTEDSGSVVSGQICWSVFSYMKNTDLNANQTAEWIVSIQLADQRPSTWSQSHRDPCSHTHTHTQTLIDLQAREHLHAGAIG